MIKCLLLLALVVLVVVVGFRYAQAAQINPATTPDRLRFQLVGDEAVASPDGRGIVTGWKAIAVRDRVTQQCYVLFSAGAALTATGPTSCP